MKKTIPVLAVFAALAGVLLAANFGVVSDASRRVVVGTSVISGDGTVTNSYGFTFATNPVVVSVQCGLNTTITNVVEATTSNFVLRIGTTGITNRWIAVGTL